MAIRSIRDAQVSGKRVLLRVDFNVPLQNGRITDDTRIMAALPTIDDLLDRDAAVILISHLGRPKGKPAGEFSLVPIAQRLQQFLEKPVQLVKDVGGPDAQTASDALRGGEVLLLENVRFEPGEEQNDPEFAKRLAALGEIFVNDAFGAAHRAHASTVGITDYLPAYAGYLMLREVEALRRLFSQPQRPFIAILGGAKVSDKIGVIENLLSRVDGILLGGGMANTFLFAQQVEVGSSLVERELVTEARSLLRSANGRGVEIVLPVDAVIAPTSDDQDKAGWVPISAVPADQSILDIGPGTVRRFGEKLDGARTIFWNGPMGVFESPAFAAGTKGVAELVADSQAFTVVGGGDSIAAIEQMGLADRISHISTGGGASLEFVEGKTLPGLEALDENSKRFG
ncbi:MAG: phosphoglycerate kinase [Thermomicrobiales bacterium]